MAKKVGGARPGAGRKSIAEEQRSREMSMAAIVKHYGSLEKGLIALLDSKREPLIKFVWEHGLGKPTEKHEIEANIISNQIFEIAGQKIEF